MTTRHDSLIYTIANRLMNVPDSLIPDAVRVGDTIVHEYNPGGLTPGSFWHAMDTVSEADLLEAYSIIAPASRKQLSLFLALI